MEPINLKNPSQNPYKKYVKLLSLIVCVDCCRDLQACRNISLDLLRWEIYTILQFR